MAKQGKEGLVARVKDFLSKMWGWISENVFNVKKFHNPEEIADMALKDMLDGANLGQVSSKGIGFDIEPTYNSVPTSPARSVCSHLDRKYTRFVQAICKRHP